IRTVHAGNRYVDPELAAEGRRAGPPPPARGPAAAPDLGVHRHTLRYRMRRVEEILGRSLDDPDVRMELWLALKATSSPTTP
ncbi:helix-turn-helix domain-containing protein, partial [Streptomyces sp. NPDC059744]|uniref:helix-turn-helix domain-containing protein n=1 Tax=Streptomyces sp. NPDC059744 TaxID=3346929 RepID=UPI00365D46BE